MSFRVFLRKKESLIFYTFFPFWFVIGLNASADYSRLDMTVAERWFYFPMIGLLGMIGTML